MPFGVATVRDRGYTIPILPFSINVASNFFNSAAWKKQLGLERYVQKRLAEWLTKIDPNRFSSIT